MIAIRRFSPLAPKGLFYARVTVRGNVTPNGDPNVRPKK